MRSRSTELVCALALCVAGCGSGAAGFAQVSAGDGGAPFVDAGWDAPVKPLPDVDAGADAGTPACTLHVPGDQPTIKDAVDASQDGDVICVAAGEYTDTLFVPAGRSLTLRGEVGARWAGQLAATKAPGAGHTLVIEGFELDCATENMRFSAPDGRIEIRHVVFANPCGVGLDVSNFGQPGAPTFVLDKDEVRAGGLAFDESDPGDGSSARVFVKNSLFTGTANLTLATDSAWISYAVTGNTFDLDAGTGLLLLGFGAEAGQGSLVSDNILHGGSDAFSCSTCGALAIQHNVVWTGNNRETFKLPPTNLAADPLFASATDRHLLGWSPAISFGTRAGTGDADLDLPDDLDGHARPANVIDVGAYEYR